MLGHILLAVILAIFVFDMAVLRQRVKYILMEGVPLVEFLKNKMFILPAVCWVVTLSLSLYYLV